MADYPYTSYARKFNEIVDDTLRICLDFRGKGQDGYTIKQDEVLPAAKWAINELVRRSSCLREVGVVGLSDGTGIYDLPPDLLRLQRVGFNNLKGYVILPTSVTEVDMYGGAFEPEGDPVKFYREMLADDQIGLMPVPGTDGSTFTPAGSLPYGNIRELVDADGNELPITSPSTRTGTGESGLGRISGIPFRVRGGGRPLREVISPYGNVTIHYVRKPDNDGKYPDEGLPEWVHKDVKYGAAAYVLQYRREPKLRQLAARYSAKWDMVIGKVRRRTFHRGPMGHSAEPM